MSAAQDPPRLSGDALPAWLLARPDGRVIAAARAAGPLLGLTDGSELIGRVWTAFVSARSAPRLDAALRALAAEGRWSGTLELTAGESAVELSIDLLAAPEPHGLVLVRAGPAPPPAPMPVATVEVRDTGDLHALVAAMSAVQELADAGAAARAVLQAIHQRLTFDWAAVLSLGRAGVEVLATYPTAMAGIEAGSAWAEPDAEERLVLDSGEPTISGDLPATGEDARTPGGRSPLARLQRFGMRSTLRVPLFGAGGVVGCVVLYAHRARAFGAEDGVRLDVLTRALGPALLRRAQAGAGGGGGEPPGRGAAISAPDTPAQPASGAPDVPDAGTARLEAMGDLVSGVAHELNNPLTAILGYAQMLPSLEGQERDRALSTIEQEAIRAGRIVRNLLAFARHDRPTMGPVDVNALLQRVVDVRRYSLAVDNVDIVTRLEPIPSIDGDEYQLEQAFLDLVNNAHEALQPDGGTITIATEVSGDHARIAVSDDGAGVPDEVASRIFDPFFTTHETGRGSGMGLSTVYGTVTTHGGRVWLERPESGGARFMVELPLSGHAPQPGSAPGARDAAQRGHGERVLVVDDEAAIRTLAREVLAGAGYRAETAASGKEALTALEAGRYDLLVVDMRMPGMDGPALYDTVQERWPELRGRIVFITGDPEGERAASTLRDSGAKVLAKPFRMAQFLHLVRQALDEPH